MIVKIRSNVTGFRLWILWHRTEMIKHAYVSRVHGCVHDVHPSLKCCLGSRWEMCQSDRRRGTFQITFLTTLIWFSQQSSSAALLSYRGVGVDIIIYHVIMIQDVIGFMSHSSLSIPSSPKLWYASDLTPSAVFSNSLEKATERCVTQRTCEKAAWYLGELPRCPHNLMRLFKGYTCNGTFA